MCGKVKVRLGVVCWWVEVRTTENDSFRTIRYWNIVRADFFIYNSDMVLIEGMPYPNPNPTQSRWKNVGRWEMPVETPARSESFLDGMILFLWRAAAADRIPD
jgi:hypothetical protein